MPGRVSLLASVDLLGRNRLDEVIDVLADAFSGYPVMRYTVGADGDVEARERRLIRLFVERRVARGGPMHGVSAGKNILGAILLTEPGEPAITDAVARISRDAWRELGDDVRLRYDEYAKASNFFADFPPHLHLNMIGVRASAKGTGLGRRLLETVRALAEANLACAGVSLTTENPRNVDLYQHFGYEVVGEGAFGADLTTWGMYLRLR